ncbi:MAG TPA: prepilin-type N-terminal cleavage/methylation domain-containing protein [Desulfuromonadales bacterium]|nr:prepilin-type N-terminal cleavage/methylation domain-containing protein [Desulfuromonadales bacterium]
MKLMKNDEKGFTLAEVMVAMLILLVALLGLAQVQFTSIQGNAQSFSQVAATSLAQRAVEEFVALDGDDPVLQTEIAAYETWKDHVDVEVAGGGTYNILYKTDVDYGGVDNVTRIDVRVESTNQTLSVGGKTDRVVEMSTLRRYY